MQVTCERLGIGLVGSGFMTRFHIQSFVGVRDADITAICSRNERTANEAAALCRELGVGTPQVYTDLRAFVRDPKVEAVWVAAPNYVRLEIAETLAEEVRSGRTTLRGLAWEKPMARTVAEGRAILRAIEEAKIPHGYLENQLYAPSLVRGKELLWRRGAALAGKPYLARCAEEHSGPHRPWFWRGDLQGGGVLNDMLCHSVGAGWFLLTPPGEGLSRLRPETVSAHIAGLKWTRPEYAEQLYRTTDGEVDYRRWPAEDYATAQITFRTEEGLPLIVEATTSWSFVGPGLRLTFEVLGPEYSLFINTLEGEAKIFFSRNVQGEAGEDLVEKQAAEQGLMPFLPDETFTYGYIHENRHMVRAFLRGERPYSTLEEGLRITELLMACYMSAELGKTLSFPPEGLDDFIPAVQQGTWRG
jgi:predicted dehydrogenase